MDVTACPLAADGLAAGEEEVSPEFGWDWSDPGCGCPPELAGLANGELEALSVTTAPARADRGGLL